MNKGSQFALNLAVQFSGTVLVAVLGIVAIPFLIRMLGEDAFGLTILFTSIFAIAGLLELGLSSSLVRHLSIYLYQKEMRAYNAAFSMGVSVGLLVTALLTVAAFFFAEPIIHLFGKIPDDLRMVAIHSLPINILNSSIMAFILPHVMGIYASKHRFDLSSLIRNGIIGLQVVLWFAVLPATGSGFMGWVLCNLTATLIFLVVAVVGAKRLVPELRYGLSGFRRDVARHLFTMGGKLFFVRVSIFSITYLNPILFSAFGSMAMNAIYQAAIKPSAILSQFLGYFSTQFVPIAAEDYAKNDIPRLQQIYLGAGRILFSISAVMCVGACVFAPEIFKLWLGSALPWGWHTASNLFIILAVSIAVGAPCEIQWPILMASNRLNSTILFYLFRTVTSVTSIILLLKYTQLGVYSVAVSNLPLVGATVFFFTFPLRKLLNISLRSQIIKIYSRGLCCIILLLPPVLFFKFLTPFDRNEWTILFSAGLASMICGAIILYAVGFNKEDRNRISHILQFAKLKEIFMHSTSKR